MILQCEVSVKFDTPFDFNSDVLHLAKFYRVDSNSAVEEYLSTQMLSSVENICLVLVLIVAVRHNAGNTGGNVARLTCVCAVDRSLLKYRKQYFHLRTIRASVSSESPTQTR